jgi:hypothetical protein
VLREQEERGTARLRVLQGDMQAERERDCSDLRDLLREAHADDIAHDVARREPRRGIMGGGRGESLNSIFSCR